MLKPPCDRAFEIMNVCGIFAHVFSFGIGKFRHRSIVAFRHFHHNVERPELAYHFGEECSDIQWISLFKN